MFITVLPSYGQLCHCHTLTQSNSTHDTVHTSQTFPNTIQYILIRKNLFAIRIYSCFFLLAYVRHFWDTVKIAGEMEFIEHACKKMNIAQNKSLRVG